MRIIIVFALICNAFAVPVKVGLALRGRTPDDVLQHIVELVSYASGLDIILTGEFSFCGGYVKFVWDTTENSFIPLPADSTDISSIRTAKILDTLRIIACSESCYIWAATVPEHFPVNSNSIPIINPEGKIIRIRRKIRLLGVHDVAVDTTIHLDTIAVKSGGRIAVMTTICYENTYLPDSLDPVDPPAPLWLIPHGSWAAGTEEMTVAAQRWYYPPPETVSLYSIWKVVRDGWVRPDAVLMSVDGRLNNWAALKISNYLKKPFEYEPIISVDIHRDFVVAVANVPTVDDSLPTLLPDFVPPEPESLVVLPKYSSDVFVIMGAKGKIVRIFDENFNQVDSVFISGLEITWLPKKNLKNGKYYIFDGITMKEVFFQRR